MFTRRATPFRVIKILVTSFRINGVLLLNLIPLIYFVSFCSCKARRNYSEQVLHLGGLWIQNHWAVGAAGAAGRTWLQYPTSRARAPSCYMAHSVSLCGGNGIFCWPGDCANPTQVEFTLCISNVVYLHGLLRSMPGCGSGLMHDLPIHRLVFVCSEH